MDEAGKKEERGKDEEKAGKNLTTDASHVTRWNVKTVSITVDGGEQRVAKMPVYVGSARLVEPYVGRGLRQEPLWRVGVDLE